MEFRRMDQAYEKHLRSEIFWLGMMAERHWQDAELSAQMTATLDGLEAELAVVEGRMA